MKFYLLVFLGGGIGASARFALENILGSNSVFPTHTFIVNVLGCFLAGIALGAGIGSSEHSQPHYRFLVTGVLGGFTTFSAFGLQAVKLGQEKSVVSIYYTAATLVFCILAVVLGSVIAKHFFNRA